MRRSDRKRRHGEASSAPPEVAAAVRQAREEAGLSQRQLAEAIGASNSTIAGLERSSDAQWSTLAALVEFLPGLAGRDILPNPTGHPPPALAGAWHAQRDLFGFDCERATVTMSVRSADQASVTFEAGPVRPANRRALDPVVASALMRTVFRGSRAVAATLSGAELLERGEVVVREDGVAHAFLLAHSPTGGFTYRRDAEQPDRVQVEEDAERQAAATLTLQYPVRELRLALLVPARMEVLARAVAWLPAGMSEPWASDLLRFLHPGVKPRRRLIGSTQRMELRLQWPPACAAYALSLARSRTSALRASRPHVSSKRRSARSFQEVSERLAEARTSRGLSLRGMGELVGLSFTTVDKLESGQGGRAASLAAYLEHCPEIAPQDLLPIVHHELAIGRDELWGTYVRLFGVVSDDLRKTTSIRTTGHARVVIQTERLRAIGRHDEPVRLRSQIRRVLLQGEALPPEITGAAGLRRRVVHHDGDAAWQLVFPRNLAAAGTSYRRAFPWQRHFHLHASEALRHVHGDPPFMEGASMMTLHPSRSLTLRVRFPRGYRPPRVGFAAWPPTFFPPDPDVGRSIDMLNRFHHDVDADRSGLRLTVDRPIPGVRFSCWWHLP
jgi:transcriptional regulator with XRE-family HTH domain